MKSCAQYVAQAKVALGDQRMTDRELGSRLGGFFQQNISRCRTGVMSDGIAIAIAKAIGVPPGEVLMVARAEREKNPEVKGFLIDWAKAAAALMPPQIAPVDVVMRGGVKVLPKRDSQIWRRRSVPPKSSLQART